VAYELPREEVIRIRDELTLRRNNIIKALDDESQAAVTLMNEICKNHKVRNLKDAEEVHNYLVENF